jgi:hypothetical protein
VQALWKSYGDSSKNIKTLLILLFSIYSKECKVTYKTDLRFCVYHSPIHITQAVESAYTPNNQWMSKGVWCLYKMKHYSP